MSRKKQDTLNETPENSKSSVDLFVEGLTDEQRAILVIYLKCAFDNRHFLEAQTLMQTSGEKFTWLAYQVWDLSTEYKCSSETMRMLLTRKLGIDLKSPSDSVDDLMDECGLEGESTEKKDAAEAEPDSGKTRLSRPSVDDRVERINLFVEDLTDFGREILESYLKVENPNDKLVIAKLVKKYGPHLWEVINDVQELETETKSSHDDMKNMLKIRLEGGNISRDHLEPRVQVRRFKGPQSEIPTVLSSRQQVEQAMSSGFFGFFRKKKKDA